MFRKIQQHEYVLDKQQLRQEVRTITHDQLQLEDDVEDLLIYICSQFVEETVLYSSRFAQHRNSSSLEAKDVLYFLKTNYDFDILGAYSGHKTPAVLEDEQLKNLSQF
ncbi:MAG: Transcription initiation factor TFIID subunit 12, partial [Paramarteilia canceri]